MREFIDRVTIFKVCIDTYDDPGLPNLSGPIYDASNFQEIFVSNPDVALFRKEQIIEIINPSSQELRNQINHYINMCSDDDILLFYFSGHGVAIGRDDFGFCATDTIINSITRLVLPLSIVKFSEIINTLVISNVIPVFIIDACYSGIAGKSLKIPSHEAIMSLNNRIHSSIASNYALFCSCSDYEVTEDTKRGGLFSECIYNLAMNGLGGEFRKKSMLSLNDIEPEIKKRITNCTSYETVPRLFIGASLTKFPFIKNVRYKLQSYNLEPYLVKIIVALWNGGKERELAPNQILEYCGEGAYGNHNKLRFLGWGLVEPVGNTKRRRLSDKGRRFIKGEISVPKVLIEDIVTGEYVKSNDEYVSIHDFDPNEIRIKKK